MLMKSLFRNGSLSSSSSAALFLTVLNHSPKPISCTTRNISSSTTTAAPLAFSIRSFSCASTNGTPPSSDSSSSSLMAPPVEKTTGGGDSSLSLLSSSAKKQFEEYSMKEAKYDNLAEKINSVTKEISSLTRLLNMDIHVLRDHTRPLSEMLDQGKVHIDALKQLYPQIAEIFKESPVGDFHRYERLWRDETKCVVSHLVFMHWLETGNLLLHKEAEKKLGMDSLEFGLCFHDYLEGLRRMSNQVPHYVVKEVAASNYGCPKEAVKVLKEMVASCRILNETDEDSYLLRSLIDNLKQVEEINYDVQIRGLTRSSKIPNDVHDQAEQSLGGQSIYSKNNKDTYPCFIDDE